MFQSLADIVNARTDIVAALDRARGCEPLTLFDSARIETVAVIPTTVALRYVEAMYVYATHLVPHELPGVGEIIGDAVTHEGKTYWTVNVGAATTTQAALQLHRCGMSDEELWRRLGHKGRPHVIGDMLVFTTPAWSGGASMHSHTPNDDVTLCLPSGNDLMILASQAGAIPIPHFGGGNWKGKHIIWSLPSTPFFSAVQDRIDADYPLAEKWQKVYQSPGEPIAAAFGWCTEITRPHKNEVIRAVVPELVSNRILGLFLDLTREHRILHILPVVSCEHLSENREVVDAASFRVEEQVVDGVVLEVGNSCGFFSSVFYEKT
jgi:hypothetical protein